MAIENVTSPVKEAMGNAMANTSAPVLELNSVTGIITIVIGIVLLVVTVYIVYKILKNLIANAIIGGVGLILLHFLMPPLFGIEVDITLATIAICVIAGLPGLVVTVVLSLFGLV